MGAVADGQRTAVAVMAGHLPFEQEQKARALYSALEHERFDIAEDLVTKFGTDVNFSFDSYGTGLEPEPLLAKFVSQSSQQKQIDFLLKKGADPNKIIEAAVRGRSEYLPFFKEYGVDFNAPNENGATALHLAVTNYYNTVMLLKLGARPTLKDAQGNTPYQQAFRLLSEKGWGETINSDLVKVITYYERNLFPVSVRTENGPFVTTQTARIMFPKEVEAVTFKEHNEVLALATQQKIYAPTEEKGLSYYGMQLDDFSQLKTILTDGFSVNPVQVKKNISRAWHQSMPDKERAWYLESKPEELPVPVIIKLSLPKERWNEKYISASRIAEVTVFLEINEIADWYKVTLQDGELVFSPAPSALIPMVP